MPTREVAPGAAGEFPLQLQLWLSPSFPVGSFAYSHGLEWAVGAGLVRDRASAGAWLADLLRHGSLRTDAILLAEAWRAAEVGDGARLAEVNMLCLALAGSRERHLETRAQGNAFIAILHAAWDSERLRETTNALGGDIAYPVAVGAATARAGVPLASTLQAFAAAQVSNLVSALVRLSAIGQTDGQRTLATLAPVISQLAAEAASCGLDDIGNAAFMSDIAAMAHETQYTRLFRS